MISYNDKFTLSHYTQLLKSDLLQKEDTEFLYEVIKNEPDKDKWAIFINYLLLTSGIGFLLTGIIFFFAYNWDKLHYFLKFGIIQSGIVLFAVISILTVNNIVLSNICLLSSSIIFGIFLAVFGQTYQTGADSYQLFLTWGIFIIPWVIFANFIPLWLLFVVLVNISTIFYYKQIINPSYGDPQTVLFLTLFSINFIFLLLFEYAHFKRLKWLKAYWFASLILIMILINLMIPTIMSIFIDHSYEKEPLFFYANIIYTFIIILSLLYYHLIRKDLFQIACCILSTLVVITCVISNFLELNDEISWLIIAVLIIGQSALAVKWLQFQSKK